MAFYNRRPEAVEAMQFTESNEKECLDWLNSLNGIDATLNDDDDYPFGQLKVNQSGRERYASYGDMIVRNHEHELFIVDSTVFNALFEEVAE